MPDPVEERLRQIREGKRLRGIEQGQFQADIGEARAEAKLRGRAGAGVASGINTIVPGFDPLQPERTSLQPAAEVVEGTLLDIFGAGSELFGATDLAAQFRGRRQALGAASDEELTRVTDGDEDATSAVNMANAVGSSAFRNALVGQFGTKGLIAGNALLTGAEQHLNKKLEGASAGEAFASALAAGGTEALITSIFQAGGLGGIESAVVKDQVKNVLRTSLNRVVAKNAGKQILGEVAEEKLILDVNTALQNMLVGKTPMDFNDPEFLVDMAEKTEQVVTQTLLTAGAAEGLKARGNKRQQKSALDAEVKRFSDKQDQAQLDKIANAAFEEALGGVERAQKMEQDLAERDKIRAQRMAEINAEIEQEAAQELVAEQTARREDAITGVRDANIALRSDIEDQQSAKQKKREALLADIAAEAAVDNAIAQGLLQKRQQEESARAGRQAVLQNADIEAAKMELRPVADAFSKMFPSDAKGLSEEIGNIQSMEDAIAFDELIQERVAAIPDVHAEAKQVLMDKLSEARAQGQLDGEAYIAELTAREEQDQLKDLEGQIEFEQQAEAGLRAANAETIPKAPRKPRKKVEKGPIKRDLPEDLREPSFQRASEADQTQEEIDDFAELEDLLTPEKKGRGRPRKQPAKSDLKPKQEKAEKKPDLKPKQEKAKPELKSKQEKVALEDLKPRNQKDDALAKQVNSAKVLAKQHFGEDAKTEVRENHVVVTLPNGRRIGLFPQTKVEAARDLAASAKASYASLKSKGLDKGMALKKWVDLGQDGREEFLTKNNLVTPAKLIPNPKSVDVAIDLDTAIMLTQGTADLTALQEEAVHDAFIGMLTDGELASVKKELLKRGTIQDSNKDPRTDEDVIEEGYELYNQWLAENTGFVSKIKRIFGRVKSLSEDIVKAFEEIQSGDINKRAQQAPVAPREPNTILNRRSASQKRAKAKPESKPESTADADTSGEQLRAKPKPKAEPEPEAKDDLGGSFKTETPFGRAVEEQAREQRDKESIARKVQRDRGREYLKEVGEEKLLEDVRDKATNDEPLTSREENALDLLIEKEDKSFTNTDGMSIDELIRVKDRLHELSLLRMGNKSLSARSLQAAQTNNPYVRRAAIYGKVLRLKAKDQLEVKRLRELGDDAGAKNKELEARAKNLKEFAKALKLMNIDVADLETNAIMDDGFFSVVNAQSSQFDPLKIGEDTKAGATLNVIARSGIFGWYTLGRIAQANLLGVGSAVASTAAQGLINTLAGNKIKSLPKGKDAMRAISGMFNGVARAATVDMIDAFKNASNPAKDRLKKENIAGQESIQQTGHLDEIETFFQKGKKGEKGALSKNIQRAAILSVAAPVRALTALDQPAATVLLNINTQAITGIHAQQLGLNDSETAQLFVYVNDPSAIRSDAENSSMNEAEIDEYIQTWESRVDNVIEESIEDYRKVVANNSFEKGGFLEKVEKGLNTSIYGFRPLKVGLFPVFRGAIQGTAFALRRLPATSIAAAGIDKMRLRAALNSKTLDEAKINKAQRNLSAQIVETGLANLVYPALAMLLLSDEGEEDLLKSKLFGFDFGGVPLLEEFTKLYGEYLNALYSAVGGESSKEADGILASLMDILTDLPGASNVKKASRSRDFEKSILDQAAGGLVSVGREPGKGRAKDRDLSVELRAPKVIREPLEGLGLTEPAFKKKDTKPKGQALER